jgi:PAS domain S-box-containing protein
MSEQSACDLKSATLPGRTKLGLNQREKPKRTLRQGAASHPPSSLPMSHAHSAKSSRALRREDLQPAYAALLADYAPDSLLFSDERRLLHTFGDAHRFLRPPSGFANFDVAELVDEALKTPLIVALEQSATDMQPLTFAKIALTSHPAEGMMVDLTVRPVMADGETGALQFLAIIDDHVDRGDVNGGAVATIDSGQLIDDRQVRLEQELVHTRAALQSTIKEIETANEDLRASNEELISTNEELQSTNQELSSVNERLYSLNAENRRQNDDFSRLSHDFDMLLHATQIGVLFLDDDGNIARFTGLAASLFNFEESDVGRPLGNFKSPFRDFDIAEVLKEAPQNGHVVEIEREDMLGIPWLIRLVSDDQNFGVVMTFIDISELRNAEAQVRRTHSMLEIMRRITHAYYYECDPGFSRIFSQVGYDEFVGLEDIQLPHMLDYGTVHPDDIGPLTAQFGAAIEHKSAEFIFRMHSAQHGEYRYVKAVADRLENGNWQIVATDVDNIYRAELSQREQAAVLEAMLVAGRAYKAFIRPDQTFGFANDKFCALFGTTKDEIIGKPICDVFPKQLLCDLTGENIDTVLAGGSRDDIREISVNGSKFLFSVRYRPVEENRRVIGLVFDGLNISELSDFADQFMSTDRLLTSSIRNSNHAMMLVSPDTARVGFANRAARVLLGLKSGEFAEDRFSITRLTPEFSAKSWTDILAQTLNEGSVLLNDMTVLSDGNQLDTVDLYLEADLTREDGGLVSVRVFNNPEKKRQIAGLRERSLLLVSSNRDLEQFTSAVAHDLRAPLRHISSYSEVLANQSEELSAEQTNSYAEIIAQSAQSLRSMVGGLLDYARIGLREEEMQPCDLADVCAAAQRNLTDEIFTRRAIIEVKGEAQVMGNGDLLIALVQNLISNSVKYTEAGMQPNIAIEIAEEASGVTLSICDNGIGIKPEFAEKIFELFRRLHSDDAYSGLGIGLTTCRKIAELHKAEMSLDTGYEQGSRFILKSLTAAKALP